MFSPVCQTRLFWLLIPMGTVSCHQSNSEVNAALIPEKETLHLVSSTCGMSAAGAQGACGKNKFGREFWCKIGKHVGLESNMRKATHLLRSKRDCQEFRTKWLHSASAHFHEHRKKGSDRKTYLLVSGACLGSSSETRTGAGRSRGYTMAIQDSCCFFCSERPVSIVRLRVNASVIQSTSSAKPVFHVKTSKSMMRLCRVSGAASSVVHCGSVVRVMLTLSPVS